MTTTHIYQGLDVVIFSPLKQGNLEGELSQRVRQSTSCFSNTNINQDSIS
jgi:hypothetical protein